MLDANMESMQLGTDLSVESTIIHSGEELEVEYVNAQVSLTIVRPASCAAI